mmetsp:Transcript_36417/g.65155  ORF Transcript_36417/g.65155 Transcript_36417/m.65155 type:complete len:108 (-) Transcript_36417:252-575(-)
MDTSNPTPRVNGGMLRQFVGRRVLLVGEVLSLEDNFVRVMAADSQTVNVKVADKSPFHTKFTEVLGVVESDNSVVMEKHFPWGDSFDMNNYNELVKLSNAENRSLFL